MSIPQRLLVATDFSAGADRAADAAIELALVWKARVDWVHVVPEPSHALTPSSDALITSFVEHQHHEAREALSALEERARSRGLESEGHLPAGRPGPAVARCAEEIGSDCVVVGSHGRTGLSALLVGSVAEKILNASPVSVLCVRPGPFPGSKAGSRGTLVYGEDLAATEHRAAAAELAESFDCRVVAVHGVELPPVSMADSSFAPPPELLRDSVTEARERIHELWKESEKPTEVVVELGDPATLLCDEALRTGASLVVTGHASRSGLERLVVGSVAQKTIRHAPCSVLILRP